MHISSRRDLEKRTQWPFSVCVNLEKDPNRHLRPRSNMHSTILVASGISSSISSSISSGNSGGGGGSILVILVGTRRFFRLTHTEKSLMSF